MAAVCYDIRDFDGLEGFVASKEICSVLEQRGFCFIEGQVPEATQRLACQEARDLKSAGFMKRCSREASASMLGEAASSWTHEMLELSAEQKAEPSMVPEWGLHQLEQRVEDVAMSIAASSLRFIGAELAGRRPGILHQSPGPEDGLAPPLVDPTEAAHYLSLACRKKVSVVYFLGPRHAVLRLTPLDDAKSVFEVAIKPDCIFVHRTDVCTVTLETIGEASCVQVEAMLRTRNGVQEMLPAPVLLQQWFETRLQDIADSETAGVDVPMTFLKEAHQSYHKGKPVHLAQIAYCLPSLPNSEGFVSPLEAVVFGGLDVVSPISSTGAGCKRHKTDAGLVFGAKWDISEYYDEDPQNASNFKMYTRHLSVLAGRGEAGFGAAPDLRYFGLSNEEIIIQDPRCRMLYEVQVSIIHKEYEYAVHPNKELGRVNIGLYSGLSGQDQYWQFMSRNAKINQYSWSSNSNAAMLVRLAQSIDSAGPCFAIDTEDSSGLAAMNCAVEGIRSGVCTPCALASAASWISNPFELICLCAAGIMAKSGRSRVFDESCDGSSKGEGVVMALIKPFDSAADAGTLIVGSGINAKGESSSLTAPNASALRDVVARAAHDAQMPFQVVDAVEVNAGGNPIADGIELGTVFSALHHQDTTAHPVQMRSTKASYGNLGTASGLAAVARTLLMLDKAAHGPNLHLRQFLRLPTADNADDAVSHSSSSRVHFAIEACEARGHVQLVGVSSFGSAGSNVHALLWGQQPASQRQAKEPRPLTWWPAAPNKEINRPFRGYFIVGTSTAWQYGYRMEEEGDGVWGYTLTMGENNWEQFQVWMDEDEDQVIHPNEENASTDALVNGPSDKVSRVNSWLLSGESRNVRLVNEEQCLYLDSCALQAIAEGKPAPMQDPPCMRAFKGSGAPEGYDGAAEAALSMPVADLNRHAMDPKTGAAGRPGDKYRIRLHLRGKYKRLEWTRARGVDAVCAFDEKKFSHCYKIIGDHSYWTFQPMQAGCDLESGAWTAEVQLLAEHSNFQIYRDGDWNQGFYPAYVGGGQDTPMLGPNDLGHARNWQIRGKVGDVFKVHFQRQVSRKHGEQRSIRWEFLRSGHVDFEALALNHKYYLVKLSTYSPDLCSMEIDEDSGHFVEDVKIGPKGSESFQILLDVNYLAAVHPVVNDAYMSGPGSDLKGPDDEGAGKYWTIGLHPDDAVEEGDHVMIHLEIEGGRPKRVWWEKYEYPEAHCEQLAKSCARIFVRHCRMLGLVPYAWSSRYSRAKLSSKPDFLE